MFCYASYTVRALSAEDVMPHMRLEAVEVWWNRNIYALLLIFTTAFKLIYMWHWQFHMWQQPQEEEEKDADQDCSNHGPKSTIQSRCLKITSKTTDLSRTGSNDITEHYLGQEEGEGDAGRQSIRGSDLDKSTIDINEAKKILDAITKKLVFEQAAERTSSSKFIYIYI